MSQRKLESLGDPKFRSPLFLGLLANAGTNGVSVGADYVLVGWLALQATDSSAWVGGGFALYHLPGFLLGVPAGALADRFNRRTLIRRLEVVAAIVLLGFALMIKAGLTDIVVIYALTTLLGCLRAVHHPVRLAYVYDITGGERVIPAVAALNFTSHLGYVMGAAMVGITTQALGAGYALGLMAFAHLLAWGCLWGHLASGATRAGDPSPILDNLRDYAREMIRNRLLAAFVLSTAGIEIFGTSFYTALPELTEQRLRIGADGLGALFAISSTGGLLAAMAVFFLPQLRDARWLWLLSIIGLGLGTIALGSASSFLMCAIALGVASAMIAVWDILTQSMMQLAVPDRLRGRAMGAWMFAIGTAPIGHLQLGLAATFLGLELTLYFNGAMVLVVIAFSLVMTPALRPR